MQRRGDGGRDASISGHEHSAASALLGRRFAVPSRVRDGGLGRRGSGRCSLLGWHRPRRECRRHRVRGACQRRFRRRRQHGRAGIERTPRKEPARRQSDRDRSGNAHFQARPCGCLGRGWSLSARFPGDVPCLTVGVDVATPDSSCSSAPPPPVGSGRRGRITVGVTEAPSGARRSGRRTGQSDRFTEGGRHGGRGGEPAAGLLAMATGRPPRAGDARRARDSSSEEQTR